jgi:solute carrier family 6 GABA transporter-like protein 1
MPRYYDVLIPVHRRDEGTEPTTVNEIKGEVDSHEISSDFRDREVDGGETGKTFEPKEQTPRQET